MSLRETAGPEAEGGAPAGGKWAKTQGAVTGGGSALRRYQDVVVGLRSLGATLYFEWCALLGPLPGAAGLFLRTLFWPRLFAACGRGAQFGANVVLRHPHRIRLGERVVISDRCTLDARSPGLDEAIAIGDDTILAEGVIVQAKGGTVRIGPRGGVGPQTRKTS